MTTRLAPQLCCPTFRRSSASPRESNLATISPRRRNPATDHNCQLSHPPPTRAWGNCPTCRLGIIRIIHRSPRRRPTLLLLADSSKSASSTPRQSLQPSRRVQPRRKFAESWRSSRPCSMCLVPTIRMPLASPWLRQAMEGILCRQRSTANHSAATHRKAEWLRLRARPTNQRTRHRQAGCRRARRTANPSFRAHGQCLGQVPGI